MPALPPADGFAISYGPITDAGEAVRQEEAAMRAAGACLSPRLALVQPGMPALRLNSAGWLRAPAAAIAGLDDSRAMLAFAGVALRRRAPLFAAPLRAFLDDYVGFVAARVEDARTVLSERLAQAGFDPEGALPHYRDWAFSALLPLPAAHVGWREEAGGPHGFVRCDAAFWTGCELLVVFLEGGSMPTPRERRARERLALLPQVRILHAEREPGRGWTDGALAAALDGFWEGCELPFGLIRPAALRDGHWPR
ncbi:hypothetical protein NVS89_13160 [Ancylobacter sp. MQZ15Z-1]|uniref:Uncharacterized protein n=1 Tax=Ancylobacter mangrovi TaxID=2972472 RepID=A0A9X2PC44_9HYPH|nr:hypothetical protein [Ancylobacter mangrovi]MCS0496047.1 hypothetical protein [Ancylobacter mangrovi]